MTRDPVRRRVTQAEAARRRYERRKADAVAYLGGRCAVCGTTESLEFDHVDPTTKAFGISANLSRRWTMVLVELKKCQLLCKRHHHDKSASENQRWAGHVLSQHQDAVQKRRRLARRRAAVAS
ncbi:MAG: hypothetical protein WD739_09460 [Actinomycetota bacterium]